MTPVARQRRVLALQRVSSLLMVKRRRIPLDDLKFFSVVIGMALDAPLARPCLQLVTSVQARVGRQPRRDFPMTLQALKSRLTGGQFVAGRAIARTIQRLVCARERAGRNLCTRHGSADEDQKKKEEPEKGPVTSSDIANYSWRRGQLALTL